MNIIQENIDELNAVLKVKVVAEDYLPNVELALKNYQKKANIPGFRPGKVPAGMVRKMYGKSLIEQEVSKLLDDSVNNYIHENNVELLFVPLPKEDANHPIDWNNQKEFEFLFELGLAPKFKAEITADDKLVFESVVVDEDLIDRQVTDMTKRYGKVTQAEVSEEDDMLSGDFVELNDNGEIAEGGIFKANTYLFIDKTKDESTRKALTGLKKEDKAIIDGNKLTESNGELASILGVEESVAGSIHSKFQFTVKGISRMFPAEINQELFDKVYGEGVITTEEGFRARVKLGLEEYFVNDQNMKFYNRAMKYLLDKIQMNLPNEFLKRFMTSSGEKPITMEEINSDYEGYASDIKCQLIENSLAKENNLFVSKEEIMDFTKEALRSQYHQYKLNDEDLEKAAVNALAKEEELKRIRKNLFTNKLLEFYKTKFTIISKPVTIKEFYSKED